MLNVPDEIPSKLICQTCQDLAVDPLVCSVCGYWHCKSCLDEWRKTKQNCPIRCNNPKYSPPSDKDLQNVSYIPVKCDCSCGQRMLLRNNLEHKDLNVDPHYCFNNARCNQFGIQKVEGSNSVFCSANCYEVFLVAQKKTDELWKNIAQELSTAEGRNKFVAEKFIPEKPEYPFSSVGNAFQMSPLSDPDFQLLEPNKYRYKGTARFFKTMYIDKPLEAQKYVICISSNSEEFFKIGFARDKLQRPNYCFSDDLNGESYLTMGQMRSNSSTAGQKVGAPIRRNACFTLKVDVPQGTVTIEDKKNNLFSTKLPFDKQLLTARPFFAVAFKRAADFSIVCYDFK